MADTTVRQDLLAALADKTKKKSLTGWSPFAVGQDDPNNPKIDRQQSNENTYEILTHLGTGVRTPGDELATKGVNDITGSAQRTGRYSGNPYQGKR